MIGFDEAAERLLALIAPVGTETVPLEDADGRVLRAGVRARRDQPPFATSMMDGYAIAEAPTPGRAMRVVGESAAGARFVGRIEPGQAVRIFTGAPLPEGATRVVLQEDVTRDAAMIRLGSRVEAAPYTRPKGEDFVAGTEVSAPRVLRPVDLALFAAMNADRVTVSRRPDVAIIATGNELVMPGADPGPDQIIASNALAIAAMARRVGARARILPIARDTEASLRAVFALAEGADLIVTIGGASVGDHDLVAPVFDALGGRRVFDRVALRPGKPTSAGLLRGAVFLGLPGNPVSSIVCGHVFMLPALRALAGLPAWPLPFLTVPLARDIGPNGPRLHLMRARLEIVDGAPAIAPFVSQDSGLVSVLAAADALLRREPGAPAQAAGSMVHYLPLDARCIGGDWQA